MFVWWTRSLQNARLHHITYASAVPSKLHNSKSCLSSKMWVYGGQVLLKIIDDIWKLWGYCGNTRGHSHNALMHCCNIVAMPWNIAQYLQWNLHHYNAQCPWLCSEQRSRWVQVEDEELLLHKLHQWTRFAIRRHTDALPFAIVARVDKRQTDEIVMSLPQTNKSEVEPFLMTNGTDGRWLFPKSWLPIPSRPPSSPFVQCWVKTSVSEHAHHQGKTIAKFFYNIKLMIWKVIVWWRCIFQA